MEVPGMRSSQTLLPTSIFGHWACSRQTFFFGGCFPLARHPEVSGIDSHKRASVLISQACLRRHWFEMVARIARDCKM